MKLHENNVVGYKCYGFNLYRNLINVDFPDPVDPVSEVSVDSDMNKSLFDLVFTVDPVSGLPVGDLAMYMSNNTSPEVKRFIELNLHTPYDISGDTSGKEGLTDDDVAMYMREPDESISAYRQRMFDIIKNNRPNESSE